MTLLIQPPNLDEMNLDETSSIDIYSAFPFSQVSHLRNRYFLANSSFKHNSRLIPEILDLEGATIRGGFVHFPPFLSGFRVVSSLIFFLAHFFINSQMWILTALLWTVADLPVS